MAQQSSEPLDEIVWRSPGLYHQFFGGTLTPMTALLYFRESPFFDRLSNNGSLWTQAQYNPALSILLHSREALEARLKSMTGLEFVIAMEAPESNFFAIRKQFRRGRRLPKFDLGERPDAGDGKVEDIRVEGVFFVVGENIYPAPRVGSVLESRQLAVVTHLRNALRKARELTRWTPGMGHYYMPPPTNVSGPGGGISSQAEKTLPPSQVTTQPPSRIPTPSQSQSQASGGNNPATHSQSTTASSRMIIPSKEDWTEIGNMRSSVFLSLKHASEYMDSPPPQPPAPLPASQMSSLGSSAKKAESSNSSIVEGKSMSAPGASGAVVGAAGGKGGATVSIVGPVPPGAGAGAGQMGVGQGRDGVPKIKRRKSKAAGISPT